MTLVEVIGNQYVRILLLEEQVARLTAERDQARARVAKYEATKQAKAPEPKDTFTDGLAPIKDTEPDAVKALLSPEGIGEGG